MSVQENKYGYVLLSYYGLGENKDKFSGPAPLLLKANLIQSINESEHGGCVIYVGHKVWFVEDTIDEILEQLENIHPSMR
jgi:hypothetical protein